VLSKRAKEFLPTAELLVLKKTVFSNLIKLEDVLKKTKALLEKYKQLMAQKITKRPSIDLTSNPQKENSDTESKQSKHSFATNASKFKLDYVEVTDQLDKIFILTLYTFHKDYIINTETILKKQHQVKVLVGSSAFK